jgi:hypothetical protein
MSTSLGSLPRPRKTREQLGDVGPVTIVRVTDDASISTRYELGCRECDYVKRVTDPPENYWTVASEHLTFHMRPEVGCTGMMPDGGPVWVDDDADDRQ